ncbi:MAG TPA: hypothetical protein VGC19_09395 [Rhodanobacter sp.]
MGHVVAGRRRDHVFFGAMALAIAAAVVIGFQDSYFRAGLFFAHLPSLMVHIHGALFVGWVLLLVVQIALVGTGHTRWHRRLGILGTVMAPLMVMAATATLVMALQRNAVPRIPRPVFFAGDLLQLAVFAIFVAWALCKRSELAAHKRLMMFATIAILAPAIDRWPFSFMASIFATTAVLTVLPLALVAYDLIATHRVHWATRWGVLLYALMIASIFVLPALQPWQEFTAWVIKS